MDINKMKLFGFKRAMLYNKFYNPAEIRYLNVKGVGKFEAPKQTGIRELSKLANNYKQRLEYEKYMNPLGLKYTITSNFPKPGLTDEFSNFKCFLVRSGKTISGNWIKFIVDINTSKPEIRQFLSKLYNLRIGRIHTVINPGKVKRNYRKNQFKGYFRTRDVKKAYVQLFDINPLPMYTKLMNHEVNKRILAEKQNKKSEKQKTNSEKGKKKSQKGKNKSKKAKKKPIEKEGSELLLEEEANKLMPKCFDLLKEYTTLPSIIGLKIKQKDFQI